MTTDDDLREQLEVSKEFLEHSHGAAVRYENPEKAQAYYEAISLVDDALEKRWDPEKAGVGIEEDSHFRELIEESRTAREEGVEAATLRDQQLEKMRSKYRSESLLERLLSWVTDRTTKNGGDTVE